MAVIPAQLSEPLAKKCRFRSRKLKGNRAVMPTIRPVGERRERRVETQERLSIVISRPACALQQSMCLRSRNRPSVRTRTQYPHTASAFQYTVEGGWLDGLG